jgi:hypothetical protein
MGGVVIGLVIGAVLAVPQLVRSYRLRDRPEPPNRRLKLPVMVLLLGGCLALAISGIGTVVLSIFGVVAAVEIGFILAGRNPWWMQSPHDRHESLSGAPTRTNQ